MAARPWLQQVRPGIAIPDAVLKGVESRSHDVTKIKAFSIASCATVVMIDSANGNRIAGAGPRRDCYTMAD